jgi:hypothetical protein
MEGIKSSNIKIMCKKCNDYSSIDDAILERYRREKELEKVRKALREREEPLLWNFLKSLFK